MEVVKVALKLQGAALDKVAVTTVDKGYSYAQVLRSAFALSSVIEKELGTVPDGKEANGSLTNGKHVGGPRIGITVKPCPEFVASLWAALVEWGYRCAHCPQLPGGRDSSRYDRCGHFIGGGD